jgi:YidC/Oxa1 family membrane protein insertase
VAGGLRSQASGYGGVHFGSGRLKAAFFRRHCSAGGSACHFARRCAAHCRRAECRRRAPAADEATAGKVRVTTDVLVIDIDLRGGTLVHAELPTYPLVKGQPEPVVLFNQSGADTNYTLQTGLAGAKPDDARPTHVATFTSAQATYALAPGQDELRVPLTWTDGNGVTVAKTFVFHRGFYAIGLEYSVHNTSAAPWAAASYARLSRVDPKLERSMFKVESFAFRGPAIYDPAGKKYQKLDIEKSENQNLSRPVKDGWLAGLQHHFVSAVVPDPNQTYTFTLRAEGRHYVLGALGPAQVVAPGGTGSSRKPCSSARSCRNSWSRSTPSSITSPTTARSPSSRGRCSSCSSGCTCW